MHALQQARTFALETIPYMKDELDIEKLGVFGDSYKLPIEEEAESSDEESEEKNKKAKMMQRFNKKIHSLYFPFKWNEALVNPARLFMLANMIKSHEEGE